MKDYSVRKLVLYGLMIAFVFLTTYFTRIPTPLPGGYFNLGDAVIMLAAAFLGPLGGLIAGAIGSGLADLAAGAIIFAPITLVVKGIEGLVVGVLTLKYRQMLIKHQAVNTKCVYVNISLIIAVITGAAVMVAGYFAAEAFLLSIFDEEFSMIAAIAELLPNFIQGGLSAILGYVLVLILSKMNIEKYVK